MRLDKILTKEFLEKNLIQDNISIMQLALNVDCCKHMIIKYSKKHGIYEEVKKNSKFRNKKIQDLKGKTFGNLLILEIAKNDPFGKTRWLCQCSCGKNKIINASSLLRGLAKTCGFCRRTNFKGYEEISGSYWRTVIEGAEKRAFEFKITPEYVWELYLNQNKKCALSGVDIIFFRNQDKGKLQTASIDRISSKNGYIEGNIQIIHKRIQKVKSILPLNEFLYWCKLIYLNKENSIKNLFVDISKVGFNDR